MPIRIKGKEGTVGAFRIRNAHTGFSVVINVDRGDEAIISDDDYKANRTVLDSFVDRLSFQQEPGPVAPRIRPIRMPTIEPPKEPEAFAPSTLEAPSSEPEAEAEKEGDPKAEAKGELEDVTKEGEPSDPEPDPQEPVSAAGEKKPVRTRRRKSSKK